MGKQQCMVCNASQNNSQCMQATIGGWQVDTHAPHGFGVLGMEGHFGLLQLSQHVGAGPVKPDPGIGQREPAGGSIE